MRRFAISAALVLTVGAARAASPAFEDLDALDAKASVFLGGTAADAGRLALAVDRRLRLVRCPEAVVFAPAGPGAIAARCPSLGWRLRIPVVGGGAAEVGELVIRRGDAVRLSYVGSGFEISTDAAALDEGHMGGVVRVKPSTGSATVTARVRGPGDVAVSD